MECYRKSLPVSEPYQELRPELQAEAVVALQKWAAAQEDPERPVLLTIDGTDLRPRDLLDESPPLPGPSYYDDVRFARKGDRDALRDAFEIMPSSRIRRVIRRAQGRAPSRAWALMLNLVAVADRYSEEGVERLLAEIAGEADAEAGPDAPAKR